MGKKMKLPFLFKSLSVSKSSSCNSPSWPWPPCKLSPRTLSFRAPSNVSKTMSPPESWVNGDPDEFVNDDSSDEAVERVVRGLRSDRLFFEAGKSSSILEDAKAADEMLEASFKASTCVLSMDSQDPYVDFRKSMDEMIEVHGMKDWKCLEELLFWYLMVNEKTTHKYIFGAFIDLLGGLSGPRSSSCSFSPSSPFSLLASSSFSSSSLAAAASCLSPLEVEDENVELSRSCSSSVVEKEILEDDASSPLGYTGNARVLLTNSLRNDE